MPEVSLFYGIRITMFYSDHNPPHFHAEYAGNKALVDIQGGFVIRGALPSRQLKLILAWCELHRDELMQNWELSKDAKPLNRIAPLVWEKGACFDDPQSCSGPSGERFYSLCIFSGWSHPRAGCETAFRKRRCIYSAPG